MPPAIVSCASPNRLLCNAHTNTNTPILLPLQPGVPVGTPIVTPQVRSARERRRCFFCPPPPPPSPSSRTFSPQHHSPSLNPPLSQKHHNTNHKQKKDLPSRPRRNRRSETFRSAIRENWLSPAHFVLPIFVHEGSTNEPIPSMPGVFRVAYGKNVLDFVGEARSYGVNQVIIFPKVRGSCCGGGGWCVCAVRAAGCWRTRCCVVFLAEYILAVRRTAATHQPRLTLCPHPPKNKHTQRKKNNQKKYQTPDHLKTQTGEEAFNADGLAQRTIKLLKDAYPDVEVYTDVALDPYNSDGHDGIVRDDGVILNDETVHYLCRQAVSQADAGADCVAPSDMMDGRVQAIRRALDDAGHAHVSIMAYTAKYASAFYGPFRDALQSAPKAGAAHRVIPSHKREYQMDPANYREALRELASDELEGADILLVKPGLPYLDVVRQLRDNTALPISVYHVSGEYAMLKAAAERGWLNERDAALETLLSFRRAGADIILTYYATQAAKWLAGEK